MGVVIVPSFSYFFGRSPSLLFYKKNEKKTKTNKNKQTRGEERRQEERKEEREAEKTTNGQTTLQQRPLLCLFKGGGSHEIMPRVSILLVVWDLLLP